MSDPRPPAAESGTPAPGVDALRVAADNMPLSQDGQAWQGAADWLRRRASLLSASPASETPGSSINYPRPPGNVYHVPAGVAHRPPEDAPAGSQVKDTPNEAASTAVEGGGAGVRTSAERPERLPTSPDRHADQKVTELLDRYMAHPADHYDEGYLRRRWDKIRTELTALTTHSDQL